MTYIDKMRQDHPEWTEFEIGYKVADCCPEELGYPENCDNNCKHCWYKEFPEVIVSEHPNELVDIAQQAADVREAFDDAMGIGPSEPHIKDSGDRTQFESGAVRDMREGKGRCDLMPLEVMAEYFRRGMYAPDPRRSDDYYWIIQHFANFKNSNYTITEPLYHALAIFEPRAYDYTPTMFLEVARHFEEGAKKYGEANWQRGIPPKCYVDSAVRHFLKWVRGDDDEPHDRAFVWNVMCCIWEVDYGEYYREQASSAETTTTHEYKENIE